MMLGEMVPDHIEQDMARFSRVAWHPLWGDGPNGHVLSPDVLV